MLMRVAGLRHNPLDRHEVGDVNYDGGQQISRWAAALKAQTSVLQALKKDQRLGIRKSQSQIACAL